MISPLRTSTYISGIKAMLIFQVFAYNFSWDYGHPVVCSVGIPSFHQAALLGSMLDPSWSSAIKLYGDHGVECCYLPRQTSPFPILGHFLKWIWYQSMYFTDFWGGRLNALSSLLQLHLLGGEVCVFESEVMANFRAFQKFYPKKFPLKIVLFVGFSNLLNTFKAVIMLRIFKASFQNVSFAILACMACLLILDCGDIWQLLFYSQSFHPAKMLLCFG